ncbi:BTB/POZ domain-containing protein 2-like isoform X2 [Limulus polyphemus]|uniref:BTB/POZ domain-containing protein 2-like isoform X2 n=1 Tax=Limulus polyphemus TaxID=6850 RepID=A0ABM1T8V1_LIMPO|nr:BTB/POZ domain-containing protein 2-like isoform X2 [Limulus polyphemus]
MSRKKLLTESQLGRSSHFNLLRKSRHFSTSSVKPSDITKIQTDDSALPTAPTPGQVLYNSEEQHDVIFMVGKGENIWRFPCHSFILRDASPAFQSLLICEVTNWDRVLTLTVEDVEPHVFEKLLRFVYCGAEDVSPTSVQMALELFAASKKYNIHKLSTICLCYLYDHVTEKNVLEVLTYLKLLFATNSYDDEQNLQNELFLKCFTLIDVYAEFVLSTSDFDNLDSDIVMDIVIRDTLQVKSEVTVFKALIRWACQEAKRQKIELNSMNKRATLGKLLYCCRYLVMSMQEFCGGPAMSGVLTDEEKDILIAHLNGDSSIPLPEQLSDRKLAIKRCELSVQLTNPPPPLKGTTRNSPDSQSSCPVKNKKKCKKLLKGLESILIHVIQLLD